MADNLEKNEDEATLETASSSEAASSVAETSVPTDEAATSSSTDKAGKKNGFSRRGKQDEGASPRTPDLGDFVRHGTPLSESDAHILELTNIKQRAQSKQQTRDRVSFSVALGASKRDARRAAELGLAAVTRNQHLETKMRSYSSRLSVQTELEGEYKKAQAAFQQANENLHQIIERLKQENAALKSQLASSGTAE